MALKTKRAGLVAAEKAKKKAASVGAELGLRASQAAEASAGHLSSLAGRAVELAPARLREAPELLRQQVEVGAAALAKLPQEALAAPAAVAERVRESLPAVPPRLAATPGRLARRRRLLVVAAALTASLGAGLAVRRARRKKERARLAAVDALAEQAPARPSEPAESEGQAVFITDGSTARS